MMSVLLLYLRLTIPHNRSFIRIPVTNGDQVRCSYPDNINLLNLIWILNLQPRTNFTTVLFVRRLKKVLDFIRIDEIKLLVSSVGVNWLFLIIVTKLN